MIGAAKGKGRGVYTTKALKAETVIEQSPVIVLSATDRKLLDKTLLHDYIFEWGENKSYCCMAMGYVPMYNHSFASNCEYHMDFMLAIITVKTVRPVVAGEELFINYNGDWDNKSPLWFAVK